jgi:eukaryotic-like serine/threonine-protein kinase
MPPRNPRHRFGEADALLDAALDLPPAERLAFVDRACASDPELHAAVRRLLDAHDRGEHFLEVPAAAIGLPLMDQDDVPALAAGRAPTRVGPFRVVREIGRGGMGAVYLAERDDDQFRQRVALKLVRGGMGEEYLVRRFLEERRILAALEHPNVARLVDGGISPDGLPYFAMEYVEGEPITTYCDARRVPIEGRLRLFLDVCAAVEYAHRSLIVHRDLKPGNILVTGDGVVKLLDFGIARLVDDEGGAGLTGTGVRLMTPEYASPEQFLGKPVTTQSDVYSLGVLLYELLTGRHPYRSPGAPRHVIEQRVLSLDPPSLSAQARTTGELAFGRGLTPQRLARRLRGDLDTIVLKAVRKEPERRYPSVQELGADIRRYLTGLPVQARPETPWYRARKFAGRHRAGVVVTVVALLLLQGFALREAHLRRQAEAAAVEAASAARRAEAVQDYLIRIFEVSDPYGLTGERGDDITARTLLDRGAEQITVDASLDPDIQAALLGVLGRVYTNLGLFEQAAPLLQQTLAQRRARFDAPHPALADALAHLGDHHLARSEYDDAEPLLRDALEQRRLLFGDVHPAVAESLDRLATLMQQQSLYDDAEALFREALDVRRATVGPDHPDVGAGLHNLGLVLWWKADYEEAERLYRDALAVRRRALPADHLFTSQTMHNLAQVLQTLGRTDEAEAIFRESLAAKRRTLGDAHPSVTIHLNNLGRLLWETGQMDESEMLIREALRLDRQIFGDEHAFVAASLEHLGAALRARGDFGGAEAAYRQALALNSRLLGPTHAWTGLTLNSLGLVWYGVGDLDSAIASFQDALTIFEERFGPDHPFTAAATVHMARAMVERGNATAAEPLLRMVIERLGPHLPRGRDQYVLAHTGLGRALIARSRADEALAVLGEARRLGTDHFGEEDRRTAEAEHGLGVALMALERYAEAEPLLLRSNSRLEASPIRQPRLLAESRASLADLYRRLGRVADAARFDNAGVARNP